MENKCFYTTEVEWTGERHGDLRAPVLPNLQVDAPPEFKGHEGENRLATARLEYNAAVQDYNTTRGNFPTVMSAKLYGFKEEPYFKAEEGAKQVPRIDSNTLRPNQGTPANK